mmetsp:Transcript_59402/g.139155  ORF Transcript_59402/g.139155 Transcript_59402/m.139155 type:complete len:205 (-) Transcript_59402:96-710(-)
MAPALVILLDLCRHGADSHAHHVEDHVGPNEENDDPEGKPQVRQCQLVWLSAPHEAQSREHVVHASTQRAAPPPLHRHLLHELSGVRRLAQRVQKILDHGPDGDTRENSYQQLEDDGDGWNPQGREGYARSPDRQGTNSLYELDIEGSHRITFSIQGRFQRHLVVNDVVEREGHRQDESPTSQEPNRIEDFGCLMYMVPKVIAP